VTGKLLLAGFLAAAAAMAQTWSIEGGVGYGWYHNATISGSAGTATAGVRNQYTAAGVVSEDLFEHFSGEFRYIYHPGETFLESGSASGNLQAYSHTFTYDALLHLKPRSSRFRPFVAFGGGGKYYGTSGPVARQPVPAIAGLKAQSQWKPVFDFGGGVKYNVNGHVVVSGMLRDYITPFPGNLFAPVGGATSSGVLHQITPMFGIGFRF
jgi:opacity protein-like surface antigen